ncbi:hypothetical protein BANT10_00597 [Brevibacterium antiquum]|uniref:Uncharacterized protein n=1 Tax=Brevibacterium antiquum TaxID=234835 RepID=A0A2H1I5H8_9MICO|nr:hypothetical protein BANT10_00597 [Brevibacterium antiquum]
MRNLVMGWQTMIATYLIGMLFRAAAGRFGRCAFRREGFCTVETSVPADRSAEATDWEPVWRFRTIPSYEAPRET